ncbi:MAG: glycosyltransferase family 4 protein [Myxococcota bacterium]
MNLLSVADPFAIVGSNAVGGVEQLIAALDSALVEAGHTSLVIAAEGSRCDGELIGLPVSEAVTDDGAAAALEALRALIERTLDEYTIDVVHVHGHDVLGAMPRGDVPVLATLHQPPAWYPTRVFAHQQPSMRFTCVSHNQRRSFFADAPVEVIPDGVDLTLFAPVANKDDYVVSLGRICPQKGFHLALEAARLARVSAKLAGAISPYPSHLQYFRDSIVPRLDGERAFVGAVGGLRKRVLLARARALIVPSLIDATSSLAAMEALACGTPVIAMRRGALPEIVEHGVTGFLVDGFLDMVDAITNVSSISPEACRAAAERRFDGRRMKRAYLELYERMVLDAPLSQTTASAARTMHHVSNGTLTGFSNSR